MRTIFVWFLLLVNVSYVSRWTSVFLNYVPTKLQQFIGGIFLCLFLVVDSCVDIIRIMLQFVHMEIPQMRDHSEILHQNQTIYTCM